MRFEFTFGQGRRTPRPAPGDPMRLLVLGDFDGRSSRGAIEPVAGRRPVRVDIDNLERFLERLEAVVDVPLAGAPAPNRLAIATPDDLHPDRLFEQEDLFSALRKTRRRLLDRSTFAAAAAEVRSWEADAPGERSDADPRGPAPTSHESDSDTLGRLLGQAAPPATAARAAASTSVAELIRPIVAEHVVAPPPDDQKSLLAKVDAAIAAKMRALLHAPEFQALESAWRGLDYLVRHVETSESLQIFALNVSKAELLADLAAADDLEQSALFQILVEGTVRSPGADPWGLVLGFYSFGLGGEDLASLARLAALAQAAGAPFVGAASGDLLDIALRSPERLASEAHWLTLRARGEAAYLGLAGPRVLLRLPYGKTTDPVSAFAFEEFTDPPERDAYLWGSPALAIAVHYAETFAQSGWESGPGSSFELGGLPVHLRTEGGERAMMPCAETWLSDSQAESLFRHGLIALQSIRGKDAVRIARIRSLAEPATALAGRWS